METYAGIDLHSSNNYIGIINEQDQRLYGKRIPNELDRVLMALEPFRDTLQGVVVESTYNWYWLVDGLQEHGYKLHLANPSAIKQYEGLKYTDDKSGYQLKPGHFVNSTSYLRMIFYPFLPVVSHPSGLLSIQTGLESLSQIIVQMLLFHRVLLGQNYE